MDRRVGGRLSGNFCTMDDTSSHPLGSDNLRLCRLVPASCDKLCTGETDDHPTLKPMREDALTGQPLITGVLHHQCTEDPAN